MIDRAIIPPALATLAWRLLMLERHLLPHPRLLIGLGTGASDNHVIPTAGFGGVRHRQPGKSDQRQEYRWQPGPRLRSVE